MIEEYLRVDKYPPLEFCVCCLENRCTQKLNFQISKHINIFRRRYNNLTFYLCDTCFALACLCNKDVSIIRCVDKEISQSVYTTISKMSKGAGKPDEWLNYYNYEKS